MLIVERKILGITLTVLAWDAICLKVAFAKTENNQRSKVCGGRSRVSSILEILKMRCLKNTDQKLSSQNFAF